MHLLDDLAPEQLAGRRVLLRLGLDVPLSGGVVRGDFRIKRLLPTVRRLLEARAEVLILSHLGRQGESLKPVAGHLENFFPVHFAETIEAMPASGNWPQGAAVLLENLRRDPGEESNAPDFAEKLARQGDLYVNEAFSAAHRPHASIVGLPALLPGYAGQEFAEEINQLSQLFRPAPPLVVIIGGAKIGTKLPLVRKFLGLAEKIFIGGALAHSFFKFLGYEIGRSLWDHDIRDLGDLVRDSRIVLPLEVLVKGGASVARAAPDAVPPDAVIVDAGPAALGQLAELIDRAGTILWNGPLGNYEEGFTAGTHDLARLIAHRASVKRAHTVIGGGDTIAAIENLHLLDRFGFVSTGGGAMLEYLSQGTLPGIEALEESAQKFTASL